MITANTRHNKCTDACILLHMLKCGSISYEWIFLWIDFLYFFFKFASSSSPFPPSQFNTRWRWWGVSFISRALLDSPFSYQHAIETCPCDYRVPPAEVMSRLRGVCVCRSGCKQKHFNIQFFILTTSDLVLFFKGFRKRLAQYRRFPCNFAKTHSKASVLNLLLPSGPNLRVLNSHS